MDNDLIIKEYIQITCGNIPESIRWSRRAGQEYCEVFHS